MSKKYKNKQSCLALNSFTFGHKFPLFLNGKPFFILLSIMHLFLNVALLTDLVENTHFISQDFEFLIVSILENLIF